MYRLSLLFTTAALLFACGAGSTLTRKDVLVQYDQVATLSSGVKDAAGRDAALLAPKGFERAQRLLEEAVDHAQSADKVRTEQTAKQGLEALAQVNRTIVLAQEEMQEVLTTRQRAQKEGAASLLKEGFSSADEQLREASVLLEANNLEEARAQRPALMERYASLELEAIKRGVVEGAQTAVQEAEKAEAEEYAPRTLAEAKEELRLTRAVLESDRTRRAEAEGHARRAIWLAGRSRSITELAREFERDEYELEDIVLWHEAQLDLVNEPLTSPLPFDKSDRAAVLSLQKSIRSLLGALDESRGTARKNEQEIASLQKRVGEAHTQLAELAEKHQAELEKLRTASAGELQQQLGELKKKYEGQLSAEARKAQEAERVRQQAEERFKRVESLFAAGEATVARNGDNVRIDVYGFDFSPGEATIGSANFGLLDRIVSAVRTFPGGKVRVGGHTDSVGSDARNLQLSIDRAAAVKLFLIQIGGIDAARVESDGYGESKPVAPNTTKQGRAKNRRVEVLIINQ